MRGSMRMILGQNKKACMTISNIVCLITLLVKETAHVYIINTLQKFISVR